MVGSSFGINRRSSTGRLIHQILPTVSSRWVPNRSWTSSTRNFGYLQITEPLPLDRKQQAYAVHLTAAGIDVAAVELGGNSKLVTYLWCYQHQLQSDGEEKQEYLRINIYMLFEKKSWIACTPEWLAKDEILFKSLSVSGWTTNFQRFFFYVNLEDSGRMADLWNWWAGRKFNQVR